MASVVPSNWFCNQNLGIFQSDLSKIVNALDSSDSGKRTRVDKYVVLDLASDPRFPDNGAFKKIYYCVFAPDERGEFIVFVAAKDSINSYQFRKERRVLTLMKGSSAIVEPLLIRAVGTEGYIISELYNRGTLSSFIQQPDFMRGALSTHLIGYAIIQALAECHAHGIVLRDLKSDNILVRELSNGTFEAKFIDFGMAFIKSEDSYSESIRNCGSPVYISEQDWTYYNKTGHHYPADFSRDLWAVGSVLHTLATNELPDELKHSSRFILLGLFHHEIVDLVYSTRETRPELVSIQRRMFKILTARFPNAPEVRKLTFPVQSTSPPTRWAEVRAHPAVQPPIEADLPASKTGVCSWLAKLCS